MVQLIITVRHVTVVRGLRAIPVTVQSVRMLAPAEDRAQVQTTVSARLVLLEGTAVIVI